MKLIDILQDASGNMLRSKARTLLTIIAIFIGAMTLTLTNGIGTGVSTYIDNQLGSIGADDALIVQAKQERNSGSGPQVYDPQATTSAGPSGLALKVLAPKDIENIRSTDGILSVEPQLSATPEYITAGGEKYQAMLAPFIEGMRLDLTAGPGFAAGSDDGQVILPPSFANVLGFQNPEDAVGKQAFFGVKTPAGDIEEVAAEIVGVQQPTVVAGRGVIANQALVKKLRDIQLASLPPAAAEQYPAAIARFDTSISEEELTAIKTRLEEQGYQGMTVEDTIGIIKQVIAAITAVLNFFAAIALLAASFGIINTLLMAVQERTREIGLMKAMGLGRNKIFLLFSIEAVLLGFWGSLLGSLAGIGIGQVVNRIASDSFLKDLPGFNLTVFSPQSVAVIMLIIMTIAFIAGTLPARRASQKDAIEALRYE